MKANNTKRDAKIMDLYNLGISHRQIIKNLHGDHPGLTRNAVSGVVSRNPDKVKLNKDREARHTGAKFQPVVKPEPFILSSNKCQWIAGNDFSDDSCKCGKDTVKGRSYCPEHHEICIRKLPIKTGPQNEFRTTSRVLL